MNYDFKQESERMRFYKSNVWRGVRGVRNQIVERDGNECVWCKARGLVTTKEMGRLEVDHIIELEQCSYEQAIDPNNLRTLCHQHHDERHKRFDGYTFTPNKWADDERW